MSGVEIRLLGCFSVRRDGDEVPAPAFRGRLVQSLIRVLASRRGQFVSRDVLTEALWPQTPPADPGLNLKVLVTRARQALGDPSLIVTGPGGYSFARTPSCRIDAEEFLARLAGGDAEGALELWGGEPLPEDAYEGWAAAFRTELTRAHQEALETAAFGALAAGDPARAVSWARATVAGELGLDPSPEARELEGRLLRGEIAPAPARAAPFGGLAFVGRDAELEAILAAPEAAVVVSGPSGAGKSRLLAEVAGHRRSVVFARAAPSEQDEPWQVLRGLMRSALAASPAAAAAVPETSRAALAAVVQELVGAHPAESAGGAEGVPLFDEETSRALVLEGAARAVAAATEGSGGLLVDDLQWADPSSLALLDRLVLRSPATQIIVALRAEEVPPGHPAARFLERLAASGRPVLRIALGGLPGGALGAAVADERLAAALVPEGAALPIALAEVLRELAEAGAVLAGPDGRWVAASPEAYPRAARAARRGQRAAIASRIDLQPPARRELVGLLALAGRPLPARVLGLATPAPREALLADLDALGAAGLVAAGPEGWQPAHDLIGEVVAGGLPPTARARLHDLLAEVLAAEGADPAEVGRHLAGAGDARAAARALADAAAERLRRFADREAEQVAATGLALAPSRETAFRLSEVRAEARARRGDLEGARADLRVALDGAPPGAPRSHVLVRMALLASGTEDRVRADELVDLAMAEAGADAGARADALWVGAIIDMNAGREDRSAGRSDEALELFRRTGNARGIADVLDARAMATFLGGGIREAAGAFDRVARLFVDSGDLLRAGTLRSTRGHALTFLGRPAEGLGDATEALELAHSLGHAEGEAYAHWHRAEALAALGRAGEAMADATEALAIAQRIGHREWTAASLRALGIACQAGGDSSEAEAAFARSLAASENLALFSAWAAARLALVRVGAGDAVGAEPFVRRALAEGPELSRYEARLAEAEFAVLRGDPAAGAVIGAALTRAEEGGHLLGAERLRELEQSL